MGKKSKKQGQVGGRQWAPWGSTKVMPNTARPAWGGNDSSHPSGTTWAQDSDRGAADREIVWPPMVIVMNKDDDDKWKGMGNQELLDYFGEYAATKACHAYGPSGHRGMSVLIFESSAVGYMEAERLHRHFVNQGTDRNAWHVCKVRFVPGGKRQLFGFLASKEDMEVFNKHCHGKDRLKYEMKSYNEMVVLQMKQMSEDKQQLNYLRNKVVKTEHHSKAVEETEKLREIMEENMLVRSKAKEKHLEYEQEEEFFNSQIEDNKEQLFEKLLQEESSKARRFDVDSGTTEDCKLSLGGSNADLAGDLYILPPFGGKEKKRFTLPGNLYKILKPHQIQGLEWLWKLHCSDMPGGIVADDMGLGKTLQTTVFLSGLFHANLIESVLIIVPLSILDAWTFELKRCGLKRIIQLYNITEDNGLQIVKEQGGILLISYTLFLHNCKKFSSSNKRWSYVLLDEAHKIKNMKASITEAIKEMKCDKKVLLTGTPITRDLMDIYSLMEFVNKNVFVDKGLFKKNYISPIEMGKYSNSLKDDKEKYLRSLAKCWRKLSPYILRRSKSVLVESGDLPCTKHDIVVWLDLTPCQVDLYTKFCELYVPFSDPFHPDKEQWLPKTSICQYICNDPGTLIHIRDSENAGPVIRDMAVNLLQATDMEDLVCSHPGSSSKISFVLDLIKELLYQESLDREVFLRRKKGGEQWKKVKVLIFAQHIFMLHRIKEHLKDIITEDDMILIDGTTPKEDRYEHIKNFNSDNGPRVFLLTARVGGEGLTLTAATKAIIMDPSWNLSDDNQIADRIYRIGQSRDVTIYRLFTCGTIDEHAYKLQLLKGNLSQAVLDGIVSAPLVKKEESKILKVPTKGFNWPETQRLIKRVVQDQITLGGKAESFLREHPLVVGLTSQNHVFSKVETSLTDVKYDESEEDNVTETESREDKLWHERLRSRESTNSAKPQGIVPDTAVWREVAIPTHKVGLLIGRDGDTIRRIRLQSSALISPENRNDNPSSPFKSVKIFGTLKQFEKAKVLVLEAISKNEEVDYVSVPPEKIGLIIGANGRNVKELEGITGARINFMKGTNKFKISGSTQKVVEDAKRRILNAINKNRQHHPDDGRARQGPPRARSPRGK